MQVLGEDQDLGPGVLAADADVVELSGVAEGDGADGPDPVCADAVVGVGGAVTRDCPGPGGVGSGGGRPLWQGAVRAAVVVLAGERVELGLELGEVRGLGWLGAEPFLECLLESLDLALGLGVVRLPVLLSYAKAAQLVLEGVAASLAAGQSWW
jgi:hypothetical protein